MELWDEILPRAQNIQSRLDQKTIETEEARWLSPGWGQALESSLSFSCPESSFLAGNSFPLSEDLDFVPPILS
jgi:hypothetical protein